MIVEMKWDVISRGKLGRPAVLLFTIKWQGGSDSCECPDSNVQTIIKYAKDIFVRNKLPVNRCMAGIILFIYNGYRVKDVEFEHIFNSKFESIINKKCLIREYYKQYIDRYPILQ